MKTIGITGIGKMNSSAAVNVQDPIASANRMAAYLKKQKSCDLVICLTESDQNRQFAKESAGIDFILQASESYSIKPAHILGNCRKEEVILTCASQEFLSKSIIVFGEDGQRIGFDHRHLMASDPYAKHAAVYQKIKQLKIQAGDLKQSTLLG